MLSTDNHHYYILFLDDYSNFFVDLSSINKSNVYFVFLIFHKLIKTQFERDIKQSQCDNGT